MSPRHLGTALALSLSLAPARAHAAGLYFTDRGVRPMGRGGAFVAGADDLGAIWYNPAGLADAGTSVLVDAAWLRFSVDYTRQLLITDADGTLRVVPSPAVHGSSPVLPIPTIAASIALGDHKEWTLAGGILAPYVELASYPDVVDGQPSPARYALGSFDGSALAIPGVWAAYKVSDELRVGAGVMALAGIFQSTVTFSASPQDRLIGAPEQPEYDANARLRVGPIFAPEANVGVIWAPAKLIRFGVSAQTPTVVSAPATIDVRLPSSSVFDNARVNGDRAHVHFDLPAIARAGIEVRPIDPLRVELAYVHEFWGGHDTIDTEPQGMTIDGVTGLPPSVKLPPIIIPRNFQDSNSVRLGGEYRLIVGGYPLDLRAGINYESSAVPPAYLSLSSLDFNKVTLAIGGGLYVGKRWRFDALYAHLFVSSVTVDPHAAGIPRINPIKGNAPFEAINGGSYSASADLLGVGLNYKFE